MHEKCKTFSKIIGKGYFELYILLYRCFSTIIKVFAGGEKFCKKQGCNNIAETNRVYFDLL